MEGPTKSSAKKRVRNAKVNGKPTRPLSAYNFFFKEERAKLVAEAEQRGVDRILAEAEGRPHEAVNIKEAADAKSKPSIFGVLGKVIGKRWKDLAAEDRKKYEKLAAEDAKRYRRENAEYKEKLFQESPLYRAAISGNLEGPPGEDQDTDQESKIPAVAGGSMGAVHDGISQGRLMMPGSSVVPAALGLAGSSFTTGASGATGGSHLDVLTSQLHNSLQPGGRPSFSLASQLAQEQELLLLQQLMQQQQSQQEETRLLNQLLSSASSSSLPGYLPQDTAGRRNQYLAELLLRERQSNSLMGEIPREDSSRQHQQPSLTTEQLLALLRGANDGGSTSGGGGFPYF